jgi:hypothetical protein
MAPGVEQRLTHRMHRIVDGVHLAFISHGSYYYMVSNFGNILAIGLLPWCVLLRLEGT